MRRERLPHRTNVVLSEMVEGPLDTAVARPDKIKWTEEDEAEFRETGERLRRAWGDLGISAEEATRALEWFIRAVAELEDGS